MARSSLRGLDSSLTSVGDESDSDGEGGRHGPRSGRSSPAFSDTSRRSEESGRSHDMWRNGFRTRAKLGIDRFDPGRRRIMDLHKQMFAEDGGLPKVNMATPVELPGDKVCLKKNSNLTTPGIPASVSASTRKPLRSCCRNL